jgi:uncharacterized protein YabN with tetrapyrrole methylase and pyrophosphatase domain
VTGPTTTGDPGPAETPTSAGAAVDRLVEVVGLLRSQCPWTAALDPAALLGYLVEETYELYEAVDDVARADQPDRKLLEDLRGELGDVLFQVVLHAQLQAEQGAFVLADVVDGLTAKLVRRNPHVFSPDGGLRAGGAPSLEEIESTWRTVKEQENPSRSSPFDGIPHHLPALAFAAKTLRRTGAAGSHATTADGEADIGRELLAVTRRALASGVDPERALRRAVLAFQEDAARGS